MAALRRRRWLGPLAATIALTAIVVLALVVTDRSGSATPPAAPDLALASLGRPSAVWRLSDERGKGLVLNFWASWCVPCRTEMPELNALQSRSDRITVVGVDTSDQPEAAASFGREVGASYRLVADPDGGAARTYGVTTLPTTVLIDEEGRMAMRIVGRPAAEELDRLVGQYLGSDKNRPQSSKG